MTPDDDLVAAFDRLLRGDDAAAEALGEVGGVIQQLQAMSSTEAIAGGEAWVQGQVAAVAASVRDSKVVSLPTSGSRRRTLRIAVAAAAVSVLFTGGLAAADQLPGPAQQLVSRLVGTVGIDLPDGRSDEHRPGDQPGTDPTSLTTVEPASSTSTTPVLDDHTGGNDGPEITDPRSQDPSVPSTDKGDEGPRQPSSTQPDGGGGPDNRPDDDHSTTVPAPTRTVVTTAPTPATTKVPRTTTTVRGDDNRASTSGGEG